MFSYQAYYICCYISENEAALNFFIVVSAENVKHILRLADEYQMKKISQSCGKFLSTITKTKTNAMPIMLLAQDYGLTDRLHYCLSQNLNV